MKHLFISFFTCLIFNITFSQNLVPNPDFETYSSCPSSINSGSPDEVIKATGWYSSLNTPDYFNSCAAFSSNVNVPSNIFGNQNAFSGNAYCGFWGYFKSGFFREILTAQLTSPLSIGQKYYVSFKVCFAGNPQYSCCAINKIGSKFSTVQYTMSSPPPINNSAQVYSLTKISDTLNWTTIKGSFVSDSIYQYINIGNFFDDINTDTINLNSNSISYYFVDDICVSTDSLTCMTTGVSISDNKDYSVPFVISPNPFLNTLNIEPTFVENKKYDIYMYNYKGDLLCEYNNNNGIAELNTSAFPDGIYYIIIDVGDKKYSKIIIKSK